MQTPLPYDPARSRLFVDQANAALGRADLSAALDALRTACAHDPYNEELPLLAATLQLKNAQPVQAAHLCIDCLQVRPFHPQAIDVLGVACLDAFQFRLAEQVFRFGRAMAPGWENLERNLEEARRLAAGRLPDGVKQKDVLRASHLLPQNGIRELLQPESPRLSVCVVIQDQSDAELLRTVESVGELGAQWVVANGRLADSPLPQLDVPELHVYRVPPPRTVVSCTNEALRQAKMDWVLLLHAGEVLGPRTAEHIQECIQGDALAHLLRVETEGDGCAVLQPRLLRNGPAIRCTPGIEQGWLPALVRLEEQYGVAIREMVIGVVTSSGDVDRRSTLETRDRSAEELDRVLAAEPDNMQARVERAAVDLEAGRRDTALESLRQIRRELSASEQRRRRLELERPVMLEGRCLMRMERYDELEALLRVYHRDHAACASTRFLEGVAAKALRDPQRAVACFLETLEMDKHPGCAPPLPEVLGSGLPNLLGAALLDLGDLAQAREAFELSRTRDPNNIEADLGELALNLADGKLREVLEDLDRLVDRRGEDPLIWVTGGVALGHVPQFAEAAVIWLTEALQRFPDHAGIRLRLGEAQLRKGDAEAALETLQGLADDSVPLGCRVAACLAAGHPVPAIKEGDPATRSLTQAVIAWFQLWMKFGAFEALDQALIQLRTQVDSIPDVRAGAVDWLEQIGQNDAAEILTQVDVAGADHRSTSDAGSSTE